MLLKPIGLIVVAALAACGGGGSDETAVSSAGPAPVDAPAGAGERPPAAEPAPVPQPSPGPAPAPVPQPAPAPVPEPTPQPPSEPPTAGEPEQPVAPAPAPAPAQVEIYDMVCLNGYGERFPIRIAMDRARDPWASLDVYYDAGTFVDDPNGFVVTGYWDSYTMERIDNASGGYSWVLTIPELVEWHGSTWYTFNGSGRLIQVHRPPRQGQSPTGAEAGASCE